MRDDDQVSAANRASIQGLLDGDPPYSDSELREANMPDVTNLNFHGAEQQLERAIAPYYSMVQSPENLVSVKTTFGPEEERQGWESIMDEEITRTIRSWEQFPYQTIRLAHKFIWDGLGVLHWSDEMDWRYRGSGLGQFFFPRQTAACEAELEVACAIEEYTVTRLYNAIKNEERAAENGWNVEAVKKAILKATAALPLYNDWERLTDEFKNNDISVTHNTPLVRVINGFVKEFDGTVSHYITTEDTGDTESFLYVCRQKYKAMREAMVMYPYGIGTNTKTHSIRGLGYKIFAFEQQRNRSLGRLIDQGMLASSVMLQATDENSLSAAGLQMFGNTAMISPEVKVVNFPTPDLQRSVMPALQEMERLRNDRISGYNSDNVFDGDQRKTKFEISAQLQQSAQLSDSALDLWYGPFERAMQQVVRRMTRRTYVPQDPGGREVADLKLRLVKRGVPLEAFYSIDVMATRVVKSIGAGSASSKTLALTKLNDLRPRMDDVGQANLDWDLTVDAVGTANAARYFRKDGMRRTTEQTNIAILENAALIAQNEIPVLSSDKHLAHAREHIKPLVEMFQAVEQGQMGYDQAAQQYRLLFIHNAEHVDQISGDPAAVAEAASLREVMQQVGEVITNGIKELEAQQQEQAASGEQGGEPGIDQKQIAEFEKHKLKMQQAQELFELKKAQLIDMAVTKRAIADADGAARIARTAPTRSPNPNT